MVKKQGYKILLPLFMIPFLLVCNNLEESDQLVAKSNVVLQQDTTRIDAVSGGKNDEIIPDLKLIYLKDSKEYANIQFIDTTKNLSDDSIKSIYKSVTAFNLESYKKAIISEELLKRVELINMGFREYLWYKRLRGTYPKNNTNDRSLIAILIRGGQSTIIHPSLLSEQLDTYPADYKTTKEWQTLKSRLIRKDVVGYSLAEHKEYKVITPLGNEKSIMELVNDGSQYTFVVFTASWCAPCHVQYDLFKSDFDSLANNNVRLISYSLDERIERWKNLLEKKNYISECYCDQQGFRSPFVKGLAINSIPSYVLLDSQGKVLKKETGNVKEMFRYVNERIQREKKLL